MMKRFRLFAYGRVQGVFYRAFARRCAMLLSIKGRARNLPDGRVEIIAEGREHDMREFVAKLRKGPDGASVDNVESEEEQFTGEFSSFEIA